MNGEDDDEFPTRLGVGPDTSLADLGTDDLIAALSALPEPPLGGASGRLTATGSRYEEVDELGRGAMGVVMLARDRDLDRPVAIKSLLPALTHDDTLRDRFLHEAHVAGQLQHPGIVPIYELGRDDDGAPFFVMRRLEGESLLQILKALSRGDEAAAERWTVRRLVAAFVRLCEAVEFTHNAGFVHRDLKPSNVILGQFGEVTLVDWGLADEAGLRMVCDPAADPGLPGTPGYIAPERLGTEVFNPYAADVWSLGVVLFELLTLKKPHPGKDADTLLQQARLFDAEPPSSWAPERGIAPELDEICLDALSRDPKERPSAGDLGHDLEEFLEGDLRRERERREADDLLETAAAQTERWRTCCRRVVALDAQAHALRASLRPWSPLEDKRLAWNIEDNLAALQQERDDVFGRASRAALAAVERLRDDPTGRTALAELWWERMVEAEGRGDAATAELSRGQVQAWGDERFVARLGAGSTLHLTSTPPGAEVWTLPMEEVDRLRLPRPGRRLGTTPLDAEIPAGSQLLSVELGGRVPLRVPLFARREAREELALTLPEIGTVPEGLVPVPEGPFLFGGGDGLQRTRLELSGFLIGSFPVTFGAWARFVAARDGDDGLVPRLASGVALMAADGNPAIDALFPGVPADARPRGGATRRLPIVGVTVEQAEAYCAWRSEALGLAVRLPTEAEWEKAGRGADGRRFPWGDTLDLSFANWRGGRPGPAKLLPIGSIGMDESIFGVRDLAGGVAEWCAGGDPGFAPVRGSGWDARPRDGFGDREVRALDATSWAIGFRVAADLS